MRRLTLLIVAALLTGCADVPDQEADLVLRGGHVVTVDSTRPEAEAVAVLGDRIMMVGTDREVGAHIGPDTRVIELDGRLAVPGFIEGHGHFMATGNAQLSLDLTTARTWEEIVAMVEDAAAGAAAGAWIVGRGWHQEKWDALPEGAVEGVPTHHTLSAVSPDNPVILTHASGHADFVNARAMELAGIDRDYQPPEGGEVVRDADGEPTGLLRDNASRPVNQARARAEENLTEAEREQRFRRVVALASEELLSKGVTTFHDAGASFGTIEGYRRLAEAGELPVRLYVMVGEPNAELDARLPDYRMIGVGNHHLTVRSIKKQVDGALGSHSAWLLEPYTDLPSSTGLVVESVRSIERTAELALEHGFQLNVHAIGDRANREVLDIFERVYEQHPGVEDPRWRIEHAQHLQPSDIHRFAELDVIAAMQGIHATSDRPWVPIRLGQERTDEGAYRWQDLWEAGVVVTNGTDVPVEDVDPIPSFWATIARRLPDGTVFDPGQRLTREQALKAYTLHNAYAAFEEDIKGSLTPGKLADIVVLSRDIMTVPEDEVRDAVVDYTVVGGKVLHERGSGD